MASDCPFCFDAPAEFCAQCGRTHEDFNRIAVLDDNGAYRLRQHGECVCSAHDRSECACGGIAEQDAGDFEKATAPLHARIAELTQLAQDTAVTAMRNIAEAAAATLAVIELRTALADALDLAEEVSPIGARGFEPEDAERIAALRKLVQP